MKIIKTILITILLFTVWGCSKESPEKSAKINVVVSILPYADFVNAIGGDKVEVNVLIPANENPHTFEPSPTIVKQVENADVIFKVGKPFHFEESFFEKYAIEESKTLLADCSEGITIIEHNPHMWLSIKNAKIIARNIYNTLISKSAKDKNYFTGRYEEYIKDLTELENEINNKLQTLSSREMMVFHPAWTYFAMENNLHEFAIEHDGKTPKAKELKDLIDIANKKRVKTIYVDSRFEISAANTIAEQLNISVSYINPLPENYIQNMKNVSDEIERFNK